MKKNYFKPVVYVNLLSNMDVIRVSNGTVYGDDNCIGWEVGKAVLGEGEL